MASAATSAGSRPARRSGAGCVPVLVLGHVEGVDVAVAATRGDDRELSAEIDEAFEDRGPTADRRPGGLGVAARQKPGPCRRSPGGASSGAGTAKAARVGERLQAVDRREGGGHRCRGRRGSVFSSSRSCATASALAPGRTGTSASTRMSTVATRHVLELVGDDVDAPANAASAASSS